MKSDRTPVGVPQQLAAWRGQWIGWLCLGVPVFFTWLPNSYHLMVSFPCPALCPGQLVRSRPQLTWLRLWLGRSPTGAIASLIGSVFLALS